MFQIYEFQAESSLVRGITPEKVFLASLSFVQDCSYFVSLMMVRVCVWIWLLRNCVLWR